MSKFSLKSRIASFGYAIKGILKLLKSEPNFQIEVVVAIVVTIAGFVINLTTTEWLFQIAAIGIVWSCEALNTAIEKLADVAHPERDKRIEVVKDVAAGAVLLASIAAVIIGIIIYSPYLASAF